MNTLHKIILSHCNLFWARDLNLPMIYLKSYDLEDLLLITKQDEDNT